MRKSTIWVPTRRLEAGNFDFYEEEGLYCLCSKNKDADQFCIADLRLYFRLCMLLVFLNIG